MAGLLPLLAVVVTVLLDLAAGEWLDPEPLSGVSWGFVMRLTGKAGSGLGPIAQIHHYDGHRPPHESGELTAWPSNPGEHYLKNSLYQKTLLDVLPDGEEEEDHTRAPESKVLAAINLTDVDYPTTVVGNLVHYFVCGVYNSTANETQMWRGRLDQTDSLESVHSHCTGVCEVPHCSLDPISGMIVYFVKPGAVNDADGLFRISVDGSNKTTLRASSSAELKSMVYFDRHVYFAYEADTKLSCMVDDGTELDTDFWTPTSHTAVSGCTEPLGVLQIDFKTRLLWNLVPCSDGSLLTHTHLNPYRRSVAGFTESLRPDELKVLNSQGKPRVHAFGALGDVVTFIDANTSCVEDETFYFSVCANNTRALVRQYSKAWGTYLNRPPIVFPLNDLTVPEGYDGDVENTFVATNESFVHPVGCQRCECGSVVCSHEADLKLSFTMSPDAPKLFEVVTFTVTLSNAAGPDDESNIEVSFTWGSGLTENRTTVNEGATYKEDVWSVPRLPYPDSVSIVLQRNVEGFGVHTMRAAITSHHVQDPIHANDEVGVNLYPEPSKFFGPVPPAVVYTACGAVAITTVVLVMTKTAAGRKAAKRMNAGRKKAASCMNRFRKRLWDYLTRRARREARKAAWRALKKLFKGDEHDAAIFKKMSDILKKHHTTFDALGEDADWPSILKDKPFKFSALYCHRGTKLIQTYFAQKAQAGAQDTMSSDECDEKKEVELDIQPIETVVSEHSDSEEADAPLREAAGEQKRSSELELQPVEPVVAEGEKEK